MEHIKASLHLWIKQRYPHVVEPSNRLALAVFCKAEFAVGWLTLNSVSNLMPIFSIVGWVTANPVCFSKTSNPLFFLL